MLSPLNAAVPGNPRLAAALASYRAAPPAQQLKWANAYANAVTKVKFAGGAPVVPPAADGPVPVMLANELTMARSGALDTDLLAKNAFYGTNYTLPLMFINDGAYFANQAEAMHLGGDQWGVMNETGSYPGQPWLWLYTLWYGTSSGNSPNADLIAIYMTGAATILLLLVPFIPGLRDVPRLIPVHRLIWRGWKDTSADGTAPPADTPGPVGTATAWKTLIQPGGNHAICSSAPVWRPAGHRRPAHTRARPGPGGDPDGGVRPVPHRYPRGPRRLAGQANPAVRARP